MSETAPIYKELAGRIQPGESKYIPRILAKLANLEQAKILRELPASSPEEIAKKLNLDKETVDKHVQELYEKGLIYFPKKGGLRFCHNVVELRDATTSNRKFEKSLGQEFFDLWDAWTNDEVPKAFAERPQPPEGAKPGMRVVPQWKSIKDIPGALACDDVRELLRENEDTLAINPCCCLRITKKRGTDIPENICIVVQKTGDYSIDRGSGRKITLKEAMDILKEIEKYALVHIIYNEKHASRLVSNSDERCLALRFGVDVKKKKVIAPSRFQAIVDAEKCLACKTCVNLCLFEAAQMKYYPEFGEERAYIDTEKCMGCGNCVIQCPIGARTMKLVQPPEFIPDEYVGYY